MDGGVKSIFMRGTGRKARGEKLAGYLVFHGGKKSIFGIGGAGKASAQPKGAPPGARFTLHQPGNPGKGIPLLLLGFLPCEARGCAEKNKEHRDGAGFVAVGQK